MTVGELLKNARVDKGLTLDDLQQGTKIQKRYLIAIEDDNFKALPGTFYVRAFVKQYADAVGLNPNEITKSLDEQLGTEVKENQENETEENSRTKLRELRESGLSEKKLADFSKYLPTVIISTVVILILGTVYFVALLRSTNSKESNSSSEVSVSRDVSSAKETSQKESSKKKSPKTSESKKESSSKKEEMEIKSNGKTGTNFNYTLKGNLEKMSVKLTSDTNSAWSAVSADGTQEWQGILKPKSSHTVDLPKETKQIKINLGNSKQTSVEINGKKFNFLEQDDSTTVRTLHINVER